MSSRRECVVSVGFYDGVHLGHRALIERARGEADRLAAPLRVVTFDRHPAAVLHPELAPRLLGATDHKLELLRSLGADEVHLLHFDAARALESPERFVESVLVGELGATSVVVGVNFRFGHDRGGDLDFLAAAGAKSGFRATGVELLRAPSDGEIVSSSRIRALVRDGDLAAAAVLLGRPFELRGFLTGRPTAPGGPAGVAVDPELLLPPDGAYRVALSAGTVRAAAQVVVEEGLVELVAPVAALGNELAPGLRCGLAFCP